MHWTNVQVECVCVCVVSMRALWVWRIEIDREQTYFYRHHVLKNTVHGVCEYVCKVGHVYVKVGQNTRVRPERVLVCVVSTVFSVHSYRGQDDKIVNVTLGTTFLNM